MPSVRVSNTPGASWAWIGVGSAVSPHRSMEGGAIVPNPRRKELLKPRTPVVILGTLAGASEAQLRCLDAYCVAQNQRDAAQQAGIGERRFRKVMASLRSQTGLTVVQLVLLRDREKRQAA